MRLAFSDLAGWMEDDHFAALQCFCRNALASEKLDERIEALRREASRISVLDGGEARVFFERNFDPVRPGNSLRDGFLTGYYEPEIAASPVATQRFAAPIYRPPEEPGLDRAAIYHGALAGRGLEIAWVENEIEAFFLHVQGSARLRMPDGSILRIGYAGRNGFPYTSIGAILTERGSLARDAITMTTLRDWLHAHPQEAMQVMAANRSYIFFRELDLPPESGPLGATGIPLTAGRSMAVDPRHICYGMPVWISTETPIAGNDTSFRRLVIAQDTGSAILGPSRGDLFVGSGPKNGAVAGSIRHACDFVTLRPRTHARARTYTRV